ncbi:hypothetical protein F4781DRAFT_445363 [Annulohypoxylon bovei var. microspora]|nr:hypothetical protein F4781DRAFT_445363 [Annulohypoxylon bovei var. microspora]
MEEKAEVLGIERLKDRLRTALEQQFKPEIKELGHNIPIFCVSSLVYQEFRGRRRGNALRSLEFPSKKDTEIPQLQDHAKKTTEAGRVVSCQGFLNDLTQLINSIKLWILNNGSKNKLTDVEGQREELNLKRHLADLEKGLEVCIQNAEEDLDGVFDNLIGQKLDRYTRRALIDAPTIVSRWGAHRLNGGLAWSTYRATIRRNGFFRGATGTHDFNQDLFEPISSGLTLEWTKTFQKRVPTTFQQFRSRIDEQLDQFNEAVNAQIWARHTDMPEITTLRRQTSAYRRALKELTVACHKAITESQRDSHRLFITTIRDIMKPVYRTCAVEKDEGCFDRMKNAMEAHITSVRGTMFTQAAGTVKTHLRNMCHTTISDMDQKVKAVFNTISDEYMNTLVGTNARSYRELLPQEITVQENINNVLYQYDSKFAPAFDKSEL